eukprot:scaffold242018_cov16-Tisochrysis_lutea.AAC.2
MEGARLSNCVGETKVFLTFIGSFQQEEQVRRRMMERARLSSCNRGNKSIKDKPGWYQAPAVFLLRRPRIFTANSSSTSHIPIPLSLVPIKAEKLLRGKF